MSQLKMKALAAQQQLDQQQQLYGQSTSGKKLSRHSNSGGNDNVFNVYDPASDLLGTDEFSRMHLSTDAKLSDWSGNLPLDASLTSLDNSDLDLGVGNAMAAAERRLSDGSVSIQSPAENFDSLPGLVRESCLSILDEKLTSVRS
jgi:hypothetical protein